MEIEAEELIKLLKQAEQNGIYKTLNWLSFEFTDGMTAKDIVAIVHHAIGCIGEELNNDFKKEHLLLLEISKMVEKRKTQKAKA